MFLGLLKSHPPGRQTETWSVALVNCLSYALAAEPVLQCPPALSSLQEVLFLAQQRPLLDTLGFSVCWTKQVLPPSREASLLPFGLAKVLTSVLIPACFEGIRKTVLDRQTCCLCTSKPQKRLDSLLERWAFLSPDQPQSSQTRCRKPHGSNG